MRRSNQKGITLIALVITIIVLIILAGISIMMISGQDGILQRAGNAKTTIGQASAEEAVKRAILSLQIDGKGSNNGITPAKIAEQVNKDNSRNDVVAEGDTFPTNIKFVKDGIDVYVNLDLTIGEHNDTVAPGLYPIDNISESQIAPNDLFDYEPITTTGANNTKVASNGDFGSLPTKKIKITGIKSQYLNGILDDKSDTGNYGITYSKGNFTLTNTLVIPYQVEYEGEMYTVTEVDISQKVEYERYIYCVILPNIENIIYPNTVTKISYDNSGTQTTSNAYELGTNVISVQKSVILPEYITEIPDSFFENSCIRNIKIPEQVRRIGNGAFFGCKELTSIMLPSEVNELGQGAFRQCSKLEKITILSRNLKIIEKYKYRDDELEVIFPQNIEDLFQEGRNNHNCVGSYCDRYANGSSNIGFIRKIDNPDQSYITIEVNSDFTKVNQAFYSSNRDITSIRDIKFIESWIEHNKEINQEKSNELDRDITDDMY